ncbi:3-oxoacyl-ACP reductase FabG [Microterricola pindariensis]|nr:3-oxoacyl-ACP reductase FabG [Microterricola pindariensis]
MRFTGKAAVVTGGAQGIGRATSLRLAREGAVVGIFDLNRDRAVQSAADLSLDPEVIAAAGRVLAYSCDVTNDDAVASAAAAFARDAGGLHILVNNAGITRDELFFRMERSSWDSVINTNLTSMFVCSQVAQSYMVGQRSGKIVNLSSRSALGNRGQANYAAAKAGVQGFTATLAIELGRYNINVNAVAPGFVATEMTDATALRVGKDPSEYQDEVANRTPLGRVGTPADVAASVAFLSSDDAAYISGQTLYVNGGAR